MSRFYGHGDKVAYFFIAFGIYLLFRAISEARVTSLMGEALYISIAISRCTSCSPSARWSSSHSRSRSAALSRCACATSSDIP